ncbi:MAG: GxxExxY protein [Gemmatimonadetes bacterium]|nr:GxxExxY protein [Gemmatimonadota bacterium]
MASPTHPKLRFAETTHQIIGAFFDVYNTLGPGLAESAYERALTQELRSRGPSYGATRFFHPLRPDQARVFPSRSTRRGEGSC